MVKSYTSKFKLIVKVVALLCVLNVSNSWGQAILTFDFAGAAGNEASLPSSTNHVDLNSSTITRTGLTASANADRFGSTSFPTSATIDLTKYIEFTVSPLASRQFTVTSVVFLYQRSLTGPLTFALRSSQDTYGSNLGGALAGTDVASTQTFNFSFSALTPSCDSPITFRLYAYASEASTGTGGPEDGGSTTNKDIVVNGSAACCTTTTITPTTQTVCAGSVTTLTVTDNATTPTYTWEASANGSSGWAVVSNGTPAGSSYSGINTSTLAITAGSTYYYHCLVYNGTCTATSATSTLVVHNNPTITTQPTNTTICSETNTSFTVVASGGPSTYQWQVDTGTGFTNISNGGVYSGATAATLSLTTVPSSMNTYSYQCVLNVVACSSATTTSIATLSVNASPAVPPTPTALANPACGGTTLTAMPSTVAGVTWYWQSTTAVGTSTANSTSNDYYVGATATYYVRARGSSTVCLWSPASSSILVTINQAPIVTTQPIDRSICDGANTTFAVTASNASGYQWQVDTGSGFANLTNVAPYSNVTTNALTITGVTLAMTGYKYRCVVSGNSPCASVTSNAGTLVVTPASDPTIAASAPAVSLIGCNAFNLSFTKGNGSNRLVVVKAVSAVTGIPLDGTSYVANSTFGSGGTIAAGEFVVYNGTGSSVFITGLNQVAVYFYKIFEFNGCGFNYLTSGTVPNGSVTTGSCSVPAGVTAVYINACGNAVCPHEGSNELIWGTSGSYGFKVNNNGPSLDYNSTSPPTTNHISSSTYVQNSSNVTALNNAVGACGTTTFIDPNTQGFIPLNTNFLIANNCMCIPSVYDFSGLCGKGPIYVVFGVGPIWPCNTNGGIFGNSGAGTRYFDLDMNTWDVALAPIYSYSPSLLTGGADGDIILTDPAGGAATTYSNSGCVVPLVVLPIELLDFYATKNGKKNDVVWKVASEINVVYYIIEKSNDGVNFTELGSVYSANSTQVKSYTIVDDAPFDDITYYRLGTKENDGKVYYHKIISVDQKATGWNCYNYQQEQNLVIEFKNNVPKNSMLSLYDLSGKLLAEEVIKESQTKINTQNFTQGIYFLKVATPYKTENFKIIITK